MVKKTEKSITSERPPVVVVVGHIDHGKSTLLDYIRKSNTVSSEAGGITQHLGAYEAVHRDSSGKEHRITFIDTPGHEAFKGVREKGVTAADIAILVVSAEDGVKTQTLEALSKIKKDNVPYIVAINKIDKPGASVEKTKQSLAENEIYVEGYGGDVPCVEISAIKGTNVSDLLDLITLMHSMSGKTCDMGAKAAGIVAEATVDKKRGVEATLIIKNGTLRVGEYVVAGDAYAPVRSLINTNGQNVKESHCGEAALLWGWVSSPKTGSSFTSVESKKEAEELSASAKIALKSSSTFEDDAGKPIINLFIKADAAGSEEAVKHEIEKISVEGVIVKIVKSGIGDITESDVKQAAGTKSSIIVGFNVKPDSQAKAIALRNNLQINVFDIVYRLAEYVRSEVEKLKPKVETEEATGKAKILKLFEANKGRYIVGCKSESGILTTGSLVKLLRRNNEVSRGKIRNLQLQKEKVDEIKAGLEFGAMVELTIEPVPGDYIETYSVSIN